MSDLIKTFEFTVDFSNDKFERKDGVKDVIVLVENDNNSSKFRFDFIENIVDGTNVLIRIKHNTGFVKEYVLNIKNKFAELILTRSILVAGNLKMSISFIGNDNSILTPTTFADKILVKESLKGETVIPEEDENKLSGLISQVNVLNEVTAQNTENIRKVLNESKAELETITENSKIASDNIIETNKVLETLKTKSSEMLEEYKNIVSTIQTTLANITNRGHIYGIKRKITDLNGNINSDPSWTRIYDSEGLVANATKDGSSVRNDFDNLYPWKDIISVNYDVENDKINAYYGDSDFKFDGSNGEVMNLVPKFWTKRLSPVQEEDGFYEYIMISDFELQDFIKIDQFLDGRYKTFVDDTNVAHSRSGVYPTVNKNIKQFMEYSKNLGTGYCIEDWRYFVWQILYLVEFAHNDSQKMLGNGVSSWAEKKALVAENNVNRIIVDNASAFPVGRSISIGTSAAWNNAVASNRTVLSIEAYSSGGINGYAINFDGAAVNIAVGNDVWGCAQKTGGCDDLGMKSGTLNNDGRHSVSYRGREDAHSNIFDFVGGLNIKDYQTYASKNPSNYTVDKFDGDYEALSYSNPKETEGYTKVMGYDKKHPLIMLPTTLGAGSSNGYDDYCYSKNSGNRVALVGGSFSDGANAGLFCWSFDYSSTDAVWGIGARLLKYQ